MNPRVLNSPGIGICTFDLLRKCLVASLYEESGGKIIEKKPQEVFAEWNSRQVVMNPLHRLVAAQLQKLGLLLVQRNTFDLATREEGRDSKKLEWTL